MTFKTDRHGLAFRCNDVKLYAPSTTWAMKLSQLPKQRGVVYIATYSLPDLEYVRTQFDRRPYDIFIVAHSKFLDRAQAIKHEYADIQVAVHDELHSKILMIEPETLYISSANFGRSGWHEATIGLHSKEMFTWYLNEVYLPLWQGARELKQAARYVR